MGGLNLNVALYYKLDCMQWEKRMLLTVENK